MSCFYAFAKLLVNLTRYRPSPTEV